jgi:lipopolysaccharide export system protein LptA
LKFFNNSLNIKTAYNSLICCLLVFTSVSSFAQKKADSANKTPIEIMPGTGVLQYVETDSGAINKLIGNVILKQGESLMYCDSAYFDLARNNVEAFGSVRIVQPGSDAQSDYMRYLGNQKLAYMKGNVMLTDGKSNLWSEELEYNTGTKIGTYNNGGTLQDSGTTVSSNAGRYYMRNKDTRFTGEVTVTDPEYNIVSDDLGYNTETKLMTFFAPSIVTSDSSVLRTSNGTYDSKKGIAHFTSRSSILNKEQYIEADKIDYDKTSGEGHAFGKVITIDTIQKTTLYADKADYNQKKRTMFATMKPVLKQMNGKDSLFIRADTFYSAPVPHPYDTVWVEKTVGKGKNKKTVMVQTVDSNSAADSSAPRFFIGYHHVIIFSDSLQGRCDSISYSQKDSVMKMMYDPIVWSRKSQITGDTILLYTDSANEVRQIYVPNNALVVSQSGPDKAKLWDQVQGKTLTGYIVNNAMDHMIVKPNAMAIYYATDESNAYIGVNEASSERMNVFFKDQGIHRIVFEQDVKQKMTPLDKADLPGMKLSRYKWLVDKRPKSLSELFE